MLFICLGPRHWRWFAVLLAIDYVLLLLALAYAPAVSTVAPGDAAWRHQVAGQVLIGALTVNALLIVYALTALRRTEQALETANRQSETLLATLLPERIAAQLKAAPDRTIAERVDRVTVLFIDVVGFTAAVRDVAPERVVAYLDRLYTEFDHLADVHVVEKIKTIGDGYMAAGGLDGSAAIGAAAVAGFALDVLATVDRQPALGGRRLQVRAGLHIGTATAGVIGRRRLSFDIWGDAVNLAARLESAAKPGEILASDAVARVLADRFAFSPPGATLIRGVGEVTTAALRGPIGDGPGAMAC